MQRAVSILKCGKNSLTSGLWGRVFLKNMAGMDYYALRMDTAFRTAVSVHTGLNSLTLLQWGTEEQKQKYLSPQAKGEKVGAFGLTEPGAGTDVVAMSSTTVRDGENYVLNGQKT